MAKARAPWELLKESRERSGRTQEQVAAVLGVSQPAVARWERGKSMPINLRATAKAYGIDAEKLIAAFVIERKRKAAA